MATPMMDQYNAIKKQYHDCILFFRLGDFYEMFGDDAKEASGILNITLTARHKGTEHEMPMCGVPHHAAQGYIAQLTQAGKKVALCEQVTDPNAKGIVERAVVRVITPGTTFDDTVLAAKQHNYLTGIVAAREMFGVCSVDITTGECKVTEVRGESRVLDELAVLDPAEIILLNRHECDEMFIDQLKQRAYLHTYQPSGFQSDQEFLCERFQVSSLDSFGLSAEHDLAIRAAALVVRYVHETQKTALVHLVRIQLYLSSGQMLLDRATMRNLELVVNNATFEEYGSLLGAIDQTMTSMGGRLLRAHVVRPLIVREHIQQRLDAVASLVKASQDVQQVRELLTHVRDIERLLGRIVARRGTPRDLLALRESLRHIPEIAQLVGTHAHVTRLIGALPDTSTLVAYLDASLHDDPPAQLVHGDVIAPGFSPELDELRDILRNGKEYIAQLQAREIERTRISSLKVKFNKVFGYYIEVSKANAALVPSDYERKQTLMNAERFSTPELKEYEVKVLMAQDEIATREATLFEELCARVSDERAVLLALAHQIAQIDVMCSHAQTAMMHRYVQPEIGETVTIQITGGRHPVIEQLLKREQYIPNDTHLDADECRMVLLTGPNMGGKSSYLRQTALIVLLAHIGSFVPADKAVIGVVDRIFTRVGASDNLAQGQSTFMVEMQEAAHILHNATSRSLVILDELGRGTSTYDGVAIAWALMEYLHTTVQAKTLFATHYHELIHVADELVGARNYSVAVQETKDGVIFLHKVVPGAINQSYGVDVAKLAGLPKSVITRAYELLVTLEQHDAQHPHPQQGALPLSSQQGRHPILDELKDLTIDSMTPLEALQWLASRHESLRNEL